MIDKDVSQKFRLKKIKERNNYFIKEIDQNELLSNKNKKVFSTLNYNEHFLTLVFAVTVSISISAFASLINIFHGIMSSTIGLNISAIIARIKRYKAIIKKKQKKRNEVALLAKAILDCIKGLISRSLTDSCTGCNYFLLIDL